MTQNTILACDLVMNFSAIFNKVTMLSDPSGFSRSRLTQNLRRNLRSENGLNNVEVSLIHKRKLRSRTLVSAFPGEEGELEFSSSDSQVLDRNDMGLENVDFEEVSSFSHPRADFFEDDYRPLSEAELLDKLKAIRLHVLASEQWNSSRIRSCHRTYSASAKNLIHYEALKGLDIEQVKEELSLTDLMSWDIDNSCVLASLDACIRVLESSTLDSINGKEKVLVSYSENLTVASARNKAFSNARSLLGPLEEEKSSHVMVTIGSEAIENETLVADLVNNGALIVRINCAHGDPSEWSEIIRRVRTSSQMTEKPCRILMDLSGPKLRTGKLKPGPNVIKVSPKRDASGNVTVPAQVWLSHRGAGPAPNHVTPDASFLIDGPDFLAQLGLGDTVGFKDARGKRRDFKISKKIHVFSGIGLVTECTETSYIESGTKLHFEKKKCVFPFGVVIDVPASEQCLRVRVGDLVIISRESSPESSLSGDIGAHRITCPSSLLFDSVKPGQPISFDDGKIEGTIEGAGASEIVVSITHAKPGKGTKLGAEKSINVPESDILFQGLTSKDLIDLEFVASQADMVGVSFLRSVDDIIALRRELKNRKISNSLGIVLKIETRSGFDNLSEMIMEAMKCPNPLGVMIARGDLAVECGWERLAETQQEILSVCEAAHIPVIWATQVLESFLKSGVPTRAEITDVSTGRRANCVMLNKGRHVVEAVSFLGTMLRKS